MKYKNKIWEETELKGGEFNSDHFISCRFPVLLKFASFTSCRFENCDFTGALFDATSFADSFFPGSKLSYLDFALTSLVNCNFDVSVIESSIFHHYKSGDTIKRERFDLSGSSFIKTNLVGTVFVKCDLTGVNFGMSDLRKAAFDSCKLKTTDFTGANIERTTFGDSIIEGTILSVDGFLQYGTGKGFVISSVQ